MPTLVRIPKRPETENESYPKGETANVSEFVWMTKQFGENPNKSLNESTISGTLLDNALEDLARDLAVGRTQSSKRKGGREREISSSNPSFETYGHAGHNEALEEQCHPAPKRLNNILDDLSNKANNDQDKNSKERTALMIDSKFSRSSSLSPAGSTRKSCDIQISDSHEEDENSIYCTPDNEIMFSTTLSEEELAAQLEHQSIPDLTQNDNREVMDEKKSPTNQLAWEKSSPIKTKPTLDIRIEIRSDDGTTTRKVEKEWRMGLNEKKYLNKYKCFVDAKIESYRKRYPGKLPEYLGMDFEQRQKEHQRVTELLQRLGITSSKENVDLSRASSSHAVAELSESHLSSQQRDVVHDCIINNCSDDSLKHEIATTVPQDSGLNTDDASDINDSIVLLSQNEHSSALLHSSPIIEAAKQPINLESEKNAALLSPGKEKEELRVFNMADDSVVSSGSIEVTRGHDRYGSPETVIQEKKRLASTSGKRGSDVARARLADGSFESIGNCMTPRSTRSCASKFLEDSMGRLSLDEQLFPASQSPIVNYSLRSISSPHSLSTGVNIPDVSLGDNNSDGSEGSCADHSIEETMMMEDKRVRWDFDGKHTKEAPTDVRLKNGKIFHLKPLKTEHQRKMDVSALSFPDPLCFYPEKIKRRLHHMFQWLFRRDQKAMNSSATGNAIVLSLTSQQIIDLTLRLLLETSPPGGYQSQSSCVGSSEILHGNTLIVTRTKEELDSWGRTLREGSAFAVLNHSTLPLKQRKSQSGADKCTKFDVVLTTFDALKAPDVTVTLDSDGYAINHKVGVENGWYTSKTCSQPQEVDDYKQLSVLHRVSWRRVIYVDVIGRKGFLYKFGTSRAAAATAINAASRLAFFVSNEEKESSLQSLHLLLQSDRQGTESLASILRIKHGGDKDNILDSIIVDFNEQNNKNKKKRAVPK